LRPERYTILKEIEMTERRARNLAKTSKVIWFKQFFVQVLFPLVQVFFLEFFY
jgi:hypothetical protein